MQWRRRGGDQKIISGSVENREPSKHNKGYVVTKECIFCGVDRALQGKNVLPTEKCQIVDMKVLIKGIKQDLLDISMLTYIHKGAMTVIK